MSACIQQILDKYDGAERIDGGKNYDIVVLPGFAAKLGKEPAEWQQQLVQKYPVCGAGDAIVPGRVQWVSGENAALKYRGNALKRAKIWLQRGETEREGYYYYYCECSMGFNCIR